MRTLERALAAIAIAWLAHQLHEHITYRRTLNRYRRH